ncbi:hypothetical protein PUNSTDRAFT_122367 [Punctularia strigosozonata HHB-11173 SS5]|uniref:uncharacterized protein n=1 Tax=Punctularia strigosozonata (strain HHB-11173) TaxID=741275 RepID=UPI0004417F49|nr:uncharacterized protein PUNSTDRAFT_122367 [Punctularia strigosozonata HHB-11173 SS5]EIN05457.1 hypothetical protein PUNSTDRAFT_122367 [Punctularia strigosozonata HHB-11173 SS5]
MANIMANLEVNAPFLVAFQQRYDKFTPEELACFRSCSLEDIVVYLKTIDRAHKAGSRTRRCVERLGAILQGLQRFFATVDTLVSSHPDVAALVWGGLRFIIAVAQRAPRYFQAITMVLERIAHDLRYFDDYATKMYVGHVHVQDALAKVYGDILDICCIVRRTFITKSGRPRHSAALLLLTLSPFNTKLEGVLDRFDCHRKALERETLHSDRQQFVMERDAQKRFRLLARRRLRSLDIAVRRTESDATLSIGHREVFFFDPMRS